MKLPYSVNGGNNRHDYQGDFSEKDEETGWNAFQLRMYDARIGRWLSTDPYGQFYSPYLAMANNPISMVDPDGGCTDQHGNSVPCGNGEMNSNDHTVFNYLDEINVQGTPLPPLENKFGANFNNGQLQTYQPNRAGRFRDYLNKEAPFPISFVGNMLYNTTDNAYVIFGQNGSNRHNLAGEGLNSSAI